jgi:hypothetical protein
VLSSENVLAHSMDRAALTTTATRTSRSWDTEVTDFRGPPVLRVAWDVTEPLS